MEVLILFYDVALSIYHEVYFMLTRSLPYSLHVHDETTSGMEREEVRIERFCSHGLESRYQ
eukprot:scaffold21186_cov77-Skeletonema_marinoi.AAC.3